VIEVNLAYEIYLMRESLNCKLRSLATLAATAAMTLVTASAPAAPLAISDSPLFVQESVPPMNMLVVGRDHKLYYEAYNDASDLDGDRLLDIGYKGWVLKSPAPAAPESPFKIDYFGYFDSFKCYTYNSGVFEPASVTTNKQCSGQWSGDFLNYLTTTRIDALRKVLYGGYRSTDDASTTTLERSHVPQDAHSWGKEYAGLAADGYDIRLYTPLSLPNANTRHLFANTTPLTASGYTEPPRLRYLLNRTNRIWNWVSKERPVAGDQIDGGGGVSLTLHTNDLYVRVRVCVTALLEGNCYRYPDGNYKPIGLLQEFGENDSMYFGLLTGSYLKNTSGGVLRREMGSLRDEVNTATNGTFKDVNGVVRTLNRLRVTGFGGNYEYSCGWITTRPINEGDCQMWGNPVAEMMYESLRYFAGRGSATSTFSVSVGAGQESLLPGNGLPVASWDNPYSDRPVCSKPFQTVVSDINPSYDGDLPGNAFGLTAPADTLGGLDVSALGQTIWTLEYGSAQNIFIGQSGSTADGTPTPKSVTSFGNIRGLAPEEPTKQGTYYAASVAYHGRKTNIGSLNASASNQQVNTFSVALASPLPKFEIPVGSDRYLTLVPFAKSVSGSSIDPAAAFQPTNQIVDFYVESMAADGSSGKFRVNFEDVEQGADHDMDAIAIYDYRVNANGTVTIDVTSEYAAGGIVQHMGYIISGSTQDGTYLVVRDVDTAAASDVDYFLDTPAAFTGTPPAPLTGTGTWDDNVALPTALTSRTFTPGTTAAARLLKDPLWYAAKWGGFEDANGDKIPNGAEWDADGNGVPDNYFLVTNALTLSEQLRSAFDEIIARNSSASSASVNSGSVSSDTRIYQARFNSGSWTGQLLAYPVKSDGSLGALAWDAATLVPAPASRKIITVNSDGTKVPFQWTDLDDPRKTSIQPGFDANAAMTTLATRRFNYLRGDRTNERSQSNPAGIFRERATILGDIVSSSPLWVGAPFFAYSDTMESKPYSAFRTSKANRKQVVYAGANDGMLHAFDGSTGAELLAFVPSAAYQNLNSLTSLSYSHKFFVDGPPNMRDVFFNNNWHTVLVGGLNRGGQEIYALDITDPTNFSEANASSLIMWEFTDRDGASAGVTGDSDLGYTYSQPAIVRLHNGKWAAVFGNGYNNTAPDGSASASGNAVLYVVDIETGELVRKIDTLQGTEEDPLGQNRPNGLATPAAVDTDGDRIVDYVYAGDLFGHMWKFDVRDTDPANWNISFGTTAAPLPLFTALGASNASTPNTVSVAQSITSRPEVVRGPRGIGMMVLFGTGKYMEVTDDQVTAANVAVQTYYGLWDRNTGAATDRVAGRNALLEQTIQYEGNQTFNGRTLPIRVTSDKPLVAQSGWYLDLLSPNGYNGERQVSNTSIRGSRVIFTTLIPNTDPCGYGGNSWLMELDALDGSRLDMAPFDLDGRPGFNTGDMATVVIDGVSVTVPVSGLQPNVGIAPEAGFVFGEGATQEFIYSPGTEGDIAMTVGSTDPRARGRQSWRQVR
jgi:type IV pilus assembly protein PilY1